MGLVVLCREFVYGIYDGIVGVVFLFVCGVRVDGFWGFFKGIVFVIVGLVFKFILVVVGLVGYIM